jgi:phage-related protein
MFTIHYFSEAVRLDIASLPLEMRARYAAYTERMKQFGANLGMPHTRAMGGGLFELRLKGADGIARVFYCVVHEQRIVMLHSFIKKTQATPKRDLEIARRRKKEMDHA